MIKKGKEGSKVTWNVSVSDDHRLAAVDDVDTWGQRAVPDDGAVDGIDGPGGSFLCLNAPDGA